VSLTFFSAAAGHVPSSAVKDLSTPYKTPKRPTAADADEPPKKKAKLDDPH